MVKFWKSRKIRNTYRILVKIALSDAELFLVCVKTKTSKRPTPISWKIAFFPRVLKIQPFWPMFIAELRKVRKIGNTDRILVKIALINAELIVVCVKTKTGKKPTPISWEIAFFPRLLKIESFGPKCKGPILADFHSLTSETLKNRKV